MIKRDDSIDCIKGLAILMVIVFHSLIPYSLAIGGVFHFEQAVPLFLIVSMYLTFSKLKSNKETAYFSKENLRKFIKRIFIPFFIFELLIVITSVIKNDFSWLVFWGSGGLGLGAYYPWLFFQFWILLPFLYVLLSKFKKSGWIILIAISIISSIFFTFLADATKAKDVIDCIWRLTFFRYIFIAYIAYLLLEDKYSLKKYFPLLIAGILYMIIHRYELINLQPWFYTTKLTFAWNGVNFPMYFYSGFLFVVLYKIIPHCNIHIRNILKYLGQNSWEVFLAQMLFFTIFPYHDTVIEALLQIPFAIAFSAVVGCGYSALLKLRRQSENR